MQGELYCVSQGRKLEQYEVRVEDYPGTPILTPKGLGLGLLKLLMGLANPLLPPLSKFGEAGDYNNLVAHVHVF